MLFSRYALKQAWFSLRKRPGFIATVVTTMGTTLGALTCVLTLAYLLVFQPLPYPDQERIYNVDYTRTNGLGEQENRLYNFPSLLHLYKHHGVFEQVAMAYYTKNVVTSLPHQPTMPVAFISPELMDMLGIPMALGRMFDEREGLDTHHQVAVINYQTWQKDFHGDKDILTQTVSFKGRSYKVVGVTAKHFIEPQIYRQGINTGIWFPWDFHLIPEAESEWNWSFDIIYLFGKLPEDHSARKAEQQITPMMDGLWQTNSGVEGRDKIWSVEMVLTSLSEEILGESTTAVYLLLAGVLGLVLIASANITNLFVSRTAEQQSTLAIHAALGAKKSNLLGTVFAEATLLMIAALLLALAIAGGGFYLLQNFLADLLPRVEELTINGFSVLCVFLFSALAALFFAYISGKMINYRALNLQLQSSGKGTGVQVSKVIRQVLVISQVAIATVLVFANISLFKMALDKINSPTGLTLENVYHTSFSVAAPVFPEGDFVRPIMTDLKEQLLLLPQVERVDVSFSPLSQWWTDDVIEPRTNEEVRVNIKAVGEQYFSMTGQALLEGDLFAKADFDDRSEDDKRAFPVIVNDRLANRLLPDENPIGKSLMLGDNLIKIIGIVKTTFMPGKRDVTHQLFYPVRSSITKMNIEVKPNQSLNREEMVEVIKSVTSLYALYGLERLTDIQDNLLFSQYTTAVTTAALALITILLATIGLYGILSYGTQMRRFELGTRMAIGAKGRDLIWMIIKENSIVILSGLVVSIVLMLAIYIGFSAVLNTYLSATLVPVFMITLTVICLLSLFSCYWPLRQYIKQPAIYSLRGSE